MGHTCSCVCFACYLLCFNINVPVRVIFGPSIDLLEVMWSYSTGHEYYILVVTYRDFYLELHGHWKYVPQPTQMSH